jgi:DoxX-like family
MKRTKLIYWITTGIVCSVMIFSVLSFTVFDYTLYPEGAFEHLGLPYYFKIELTAAKILGILTLLIPSIPPRIKEFAYFGFGITLVSASIAHFATGDGILYVIDPLIFLGILVVSYTNYQRLRTDV